MATRIQELLHGFATVTEAMSRDWIRGTLISYPAACFELSFESIPYPSLPETGISYLGIMTGKRIIFEFQCGRVVTPHISENEYRDCVFPFIERLRGYDNARGAFSRAMTQDEFNRR